jgi:hypothetical protein
VINLSVLHQNRLRLKDLRHLCRCLFRHRDLPLLGWIAADT